MLPCTTALFSSGVPAARLLDANFGRSERVMMTETWPLAARVSWPCGLGPKRSVFLLSCSIVIETSVHVPTRSLAVVCATDSSLGRKTPRISADAVRTAEIMRFILLLLAVGGCSRALAMERALRLENYITIPARSHLYDFMFSGRYS